MSPLSGVVSLQKTFVDEELQGQALTHMFVQKMEHRGSYVRLDLDQLYRPTAWPRVSVDPRKWLWQVKRAVKFKRREHINVLELKMYLYGMRWKSRRGCFHKRRSVYLIDNQVALAVAVKGRSSRFQLNAVLRRWCALQVATNTYPILGYVCIKDNPADAPSRQE